MIDLVEVNAAWNAIRKAEEGDLSLLVSRLRENILSAKECEIAALYLEGNFKRKRGKKHDVSTDAKNIDLYRSYVWLRDVEKWADKDEALYEKLKEITKSKSADSIRKLCQRARLVKRNILEKIEDQQFLEIIRWYKIGILNDEDIKPFKSITLSGTKF